MAIFSRLSISRRGWLLVNLVSAYIFLAMAGLLSGEWSNKNRLQEETRAAANGWAFELGLVPQKRRVGRNRHTQTDVLVASTVIERFQKQNGGAFPGPEFFADNVGRSGYGYPYVMGHFALGGGN